MESGLSSWVRHIDESENCCQHENKNNWNRIYIHGVLYLKLLRIKNEVVWTVTEFNEGISTMDVARLKPPFFFKFKPVSPQIYSNLIFSFQENCCEISLKARVSSTIFYDVDLPSLIKLCKIKLAT